MGFKANNPGCGCCGGVPPPTPTCTLCSDGPSASISLTIANVANNSCSLCDTVVNGTHILPSSGTTGNLCYWRKEETVECWATGRVVQFIVAANMDSGGAWQASVTYGNSTATYSNSPGGPVDTNCASTRTLNRNAVYGIDCNMYGALTCQIN